MVRIYVLLDQARHVHAGEAGIPNYTYVRAVQCSGVPTGIAFHFLSISRCQFQALLALFL